MLKSVPKLLLKKNLRNIETYIKSIKSLNPIVIPCLRKKNNSKMEKKKLCMYVRLSQCDLETI